jgi:hypothetical protein
MTHILVLQLVVIMRYSIDRYGRVTTPFIPTVKLCKLDRIFNLQAIVGEQ